MLLCATNRKHDLDPALLSRFDLSITFDLPDFETRREIFRRYAKQFSDDKAANSGLKIVMKGLLSSVKQQEQLSDDYSKLALLSEGLSCREIKECCENAERGCASKYIQQRLSESETRDILGDIESIVESVELPTVDDYVYWLNSRKANNNRA